MILPSGAYLLAEKGAARAVEDTVDNELAVLEEDGIQVAQTLTDGSLKLILLEKEFLERRKETKVSRNRTSEPVLLGVEFYQTGREGVASDKQHVQRLVKAVITDINNLEGCDCQQSFWKISAHEVSVHI